jgi:quercetin dioxygenase-like cupin family protein
VPYNIPPLPDGEKGWKSYPVFFGSTRIVPLLGCHVSVLSPQHIPHPLHFHKEEELLLLLSGELDLIIRDRENALAEKRTRIKPNQVVFYPVDFAHTIQTTSQKPANYIMLKWQGKSISKDSTLAFGLFDLFDSASDSKNGQGRASRLVFEGLTRYLRKIRCHTTTLAPQSGYDPHIDKHDVIIIVLEGEAETLEQRVAPHGVIFYKAGEPHGMRNPSKTTTARYVVFEMHRDKTKLKSLPFDFLTMARS